MADRNIAFTIQLNGTEQVFNSIAELENAINQATQELKVFTGSEADFKKLQEEIKRANNELTKIKEGTRGLSTQKQIGEFLKFGQVVAGAFGAATTALSLFGKENEDVTQAAAKAQQILTLQYSIVTLAKEKDTIATAFNTASKIANTIATQGLVAATRLLFTLIRANPLGAFLTIISAVVGALVLFTDNTDDAAAAEENFQKVLAKGQVERQRQIQLLQAQGKTEVEVAQAALKAADDRFRMAQFYNFQTGKDSAMRAKVEEEYAEAKFQQELAIINLENAKENERKKNSENQQDRLESEREKLELQRKVVGDLLRLETERLKIQAKIPGSNIKILETEVEITETLEKRLGLLKEYSGLVEDTQTFEEELAELAKNAGGEFDIFGAIFGRVRERAEMLFKEVGAGTKTFQQAQTELRDFREETLKSFGIDIPASFYQEIRNKAAEYRKEVAAGNMTVQEQRDKLKQFREESLKEFGVPFDEEKLEQLSEYTIRYNQLFERVEATSKIEPLEGFADFRQQIEQAIVDYALLQGQLEEDPFLARSPETMAKRRLDAEQELENARVRYAQAYVAREMTAEKLQQLAILTTEERKQQLDELNNVGRLAFDEIVKVSLEIIGLESDVNEAAEAIQKLNKELAETFGPARAGLLTKNRKLIVANYQLESDAIIASRQKLEAVEETINLKRFDNENQFTGDIAILNEQLKDKVVGFAELSYREKLFFLKDYLEQEVTATENAELKKQEAQQKTIDKILDQIQLFQAGLQAIQQTVSDYYNFQFDQLEKRNKRIQDSIVGDSERANELRLEADKAYTAEREKLEKQQAKISLRLTLAQTIANVAQAVAQSLANPILAAVIAAAGVGQIAIITQQIAAVDSYKRGGRLRMAEGGLVVGPPHEQGGVKYQGGGVELEGNEVVINRLSSLRYADILSSINVAGGGKPIVMSNFDDSRIVEAIAKQRQMPLRAYVVESDITNAQTINKRLELLSQI